MVPTSRPSACAAAGPRTNFNSCQWTRPWPQHGARAAAGRGQPAFISLRVLAVSQGPLSGRCAGGGGWPGRGGGPGRGARLVEHERERPGERQQRHHEELNEPGRVCAQAQAVPRADGLRDDLREHDQQRGGDEQAGDAGGHVGQQDGQERCALGRALQVEDRVYGEPPGAGPGQGAGGRPVHAPRQARAACMSRWQGGGCWPWPAPFSIRCSDGTRAAGGTGRVRMRSVSVAARRARRPSGRGWTRVGRQPARLLSRV